MHQIIDLFLEDYGGVLRHIYSRIYSLVLAEKVAEMVEKLDQLIIQSQISMKYNSRNSARLKTNRNIFQIFDEYIPIFFQPC